MYKDTSAEADSTSLPPGVNKRTQIKWPLSPYLTVLAPLVTILGFQPLFKLVEIMLLKRFRPQHEELLAKALKENLHDAVIGDPSEKDALVDRISMHARAYAEMDSWKLVILQILTIIKYIAFFIVITSFANWVNEYYRFPFPAAEREVVSRAITRSYLLLSNFVVPKFLFLIFGQLLLVRGVSQQKPTEEITHRISLIRKLSHKWPFIVTFIYLIWWVMLQRTPYDGFQLNQHITYLALLLTLIVVAVIRFISALGQVSKHLINRLKSNWYAESMIAMHLWGLVLVLRSGKNVSESMRRRLVITLLEDIARRFESSLPKQIIGHDLSSAPLKQDLARIGGGIRALKRRAAIPTSKAWDEELRQDLSDFLIKFLSLNWAALPTDDVERISTATILSQAKLFIRKLITAAIPAILFTILQSTPWHLTGQRAEIALIVAVAWFALSIVLQVDPEFSAKTKALKEIQDIVSFKSKT